MAIFRIDIQSLSRSTGRRAVAAAAYRSGERLVDERIGTVHDHSDRTDVAHREIVLPSKFGGADIGWARDRQQLWNEAERAESRRDARVAREYSVSLPHELAASQRLALTTVFAREIADRYGVAVDVSIHHPRPDGDSRNHHAHLLTTTREVAPDGLGAKTGLDMRGTARKELGLAGTRAEFYTAEGQRHAFFNRGDSSPWHTLVLRQIDLFLASLGYLQGDPTVGIPADTTVALQKVRL